MSEKFSFNFSCPAFDPREAKELGLKEGHDRVDIILRQLTEIFLTNSSPFFLKIPGPVYLSLQSMQQGKVFSTINCANTGQF